MPIRIVVFQSTLPARGATAGDIVEWGGADISIHAPRTGSDHADGRASSGAAKFQSTLPARGATWRTRIISNKLAFQSTLPARGATYRLLMFFSFCRISIHAPRTGSDCGRHFSVAAAPHFNPRSPHGERLFGVDSPHGFWRFQSTLPARGATRFQRRNLPDLLISIHAPRTGSDCLILSYFISGDNFNPRSPHGERLRKVTILSIRIIGFAQKVYHKTVLLRISLAENAVILPEKPRNPVRTSLQKAGGLRFARAIRAARPYSISSPSGA